MSKMTIIEGNSNDKDNIRTYMVKGEKGDTGDIGPANTLSIGTVTKGENAGANITGDAPNQTLNLVLPKGDKGDPGENTVYEVPTNSVIGYDGSTIPGGYEEIDIDDFDIATQTKNGLMSSIDKIKLDGILLKNRNDAQINLNSINDGIQIINGWSDTVTNKPSDCGWAILIQNSNIDSSTKVQVLFNTKSNGSISIRLFENSTWGSWKTIT